MHIGRGRVNESEVPTSRLGDSRLKFVIIVLGSVWGGGEWSYRNSITNSSNLAVYHTVKELGATLLRIEKSDIPGPLKLRVVFGDPFFLV